MKKILLVNSFYFPTIIGGAEIYTKDLAESLLNNYEVHVLTTNDHKSNSIINEDVNKVKVHRLPLNNIYWPGIKNDRGNIRKLIWHMVNLYNRKQYIQIKNIIKEINPDIIHSQNLMGIGTYIWKIASKLNIPVVHTIHDYQLMTPTKQKFVSRLSLTINKRRSKRVNVVTSVSKYTLKKHLDNNVFRNKENLVIPNTFNFKRLNRRYRKCKQPLVVSFIGQIEEIKGIGLLIKVLERLDSSIIEKVFVCGTGSMANRIIDFSKKDKRLIYKDHVSIEVLQETIAETDVVLVPSIWEEPFGRVIIESYNQGTPVIAAAVGGIPDIVYHDKWLFRKNDVDDLIEKIICFYELSNDEIENEICNSYKTSTLYRNNVPQHIDIYEKLTSK